MRSGLLPTTVWEWHVEPTSVTNSRCWSQSSQKDTAVTSTHQKSQRVTSWWYKAGYWKFNMAGKCDNFHGIRFGTIINPKNKIMGHYVGSSYHLIKISGGLASPDWPACLRCQSRDCDILRFPWREGDDAPRLQPRCGDVVMCPLAHPTWKGCVFFPWK